MKSFSSTKVWTSKLLAVCLCSVLLACASPKPTNQPHQENVVAFDFAPYVEQGFLITPQRYDGKYEPVGQITLSIWPSAHENMTDRSAEREAEDADSLVAQGNWVVGQITTEQLVESAYEQSREMGADGIVNFNVTTQTRHLSGDYSGHDYRLTGYVVSGFAIDRESER